MSLFKKMAEAGVTDILVVVEDKKSARKYDIVFERPEKSPQHHLKRQYWIDRDYLTPLNIGAGDGWNVVAKTLQKRFEDLKDEMTNCRAPLVSRFAYSP